jgi:hypothetical protein
VAKAPNFAALVALVAKAESLLVKAGQSDVEERVRTLRGVYYGTTWSLDYEVESKRSVPGALVRNAGFVTYTGGHLPPDPQKAFAGTSVLQDLKDSQSMRDGTRSVDVGHLLIGLETRTSAFARTHVFPEGGTGLEVVTWLGDLGGGAANLARRRATSATLAVDYVFHNPSSDYGVTDNLEGDAAAYMVAAGKSPGGAPVWSGGGVADAIKAYLTPAAAAAWKGRAAGFASAIGGTVDSRGISNAPALVTSLSKKLADFGYWYATTRWVPTKELIGASAQRTCEHMEGAAREIATVFVDTLARAIREAPRAIDATGPYPRPTPPGSCNSRLLKAAAVAGSLPSIPGL